MTLVQELASFVHETSCDSLPEAVRTSVRQRVLDIIGISLAALELETSKAVLDHVRSQGGTGQARAVGISDKVPAAQAALVNGVLAHSLDFDDTHLPSILHPSAPVIPAALAAAELNQSHGRDLVAAIAAGLEVCVRLGMAGYDPETNNSLFFERGQHATSMCGAIAGAAAAAKLLGSSPDGISHAMGIAASMASGLIEANRSGGTVKRLHCGWSAHSAVTASELAQRGITGPPTVLEGRFGFFQAFIGERFNAKVVTEGLGSKWDVPNIFFKPYPANHFTHTAIDAALALREEGLRPNQVEEVTLGVAGATVRTIGEPIDVKRNPETGYQAQFSGPYVVAAALIGGSGLGLTLEDFTDDLAKAPTRRELMARVKVVANKECDAIYPHQFPAVLKVKTKIGSVMKQKVMANRGGPDRPLSDEELSVKFWGNAGRVLTKGATAQVEDAVKRLEVLDSVEELLAPTAKGN